MQLGNERMRAFYRLIYLYSKRERKIDKLISLIINYTAGRKQFYHDSELHGDLTGDL